jgi:hypothetical protein
VVHSLSRAAALRRLQLQWGCLAAVARLQSSCLCASSSALLDLCMLLCTAVFRQLNNVHKPQWRSSSAAYLSHV